ncbi:MAG: efflux RND transporter periplasmic adaptor subunit [Pelagibacteraceae bacterium]|nr:efflux RND transporter periplasmic adaptor subunit [Pelagibacteraceae bacterium]
MKTKTKIIIFLSVITIILAAIIGGRAIIAQKISVKIAESKKAPVGVIATKVKYSQFYNQIESFGTAISNQSYSIRIKKDNLVSSVNFDSYPYVKKGTVIASLVNNEKIIAPFDGRIGKREITPGILGGENSIIANLDDIKFLKLDIKLPENYLGVIKQGLKVEVSTDAFPKIFKGIIETISSRVDPTTRSILVQAKIQNENEELIPGMLLNAKVIFNEKQSLGVPEEALLIQGDDKYIYKINNNEIAQAKVAIGRRNFGKVEILSGLNENDLILAEGTNKVRPKSKVKIVKTVD